MRYVYTVLNLVFGLFFLILGIVILFEYPKEGLCFIAISLFSFPPFRDLPRSIRFISIFFIIIALISFSGQRENKKKQELANQEKQETIDYFNKNRDKIVSDIESAFSEKDYELVVSKAERYDVVGDDHIDKMYNIAKTEVEGRKKKDRTNTLLHILKTVPVEEYERNKTLYQELLDLHPDNKLYLSKVDFYSKKLEEANTRKSKIESQFSPWDGSHINLTEYIKDTMNDPDSYKHDKTRYIDRGDHLIVTTIFRGTNAFGGVVRDIVKAKVSLDGQILLILE